MSANRFKAMLAVIGTNYEIMSDSLIYRGSKGFGISSLFSLLLGFSVLAEI